MYSHGREVFFRNCAVVKGFLFFTFFFGLIGFIEMQPSVGFRVDEDRRSGARHRLSRETQGREPEEHGDAI